MRLRVAVVALAAMALGATSAQAAVPTVGATWISPEGVNSSSAIVRAKINPQGLATGYRIEYVTEAAYLASKFAGALKVPPSGETAIGSGSAPITIVRSITGLKAATSYRYRVIATNSDGPGEGAVRWITTDELAPVFSLPDARGWEMVSPVDKNGGEIQGVGGNFGGDVLQAPPGGGEVTYTSSASFADAQGAPSASQYVSVRGPSGWSTDNVTLATESGAYGSEPNGVPYQLFAGDLSSALILDGRRCPPVGGCDRSYSLRQTGTGAVTALPYQEPDLAFAGATPDLSRIALSTCAALTVDATEAPAGGGCDPAKPNLYVRSGSTLALVNLLPGQSSGTPGATLGAQAGAISSDGSRVYWSNGANLYLRIGGQTRQVDLAAGGGGTFETASADGSLALFTKGGHLYRYDVATETATDLTPGGGVVGVLGASDKLDFVYYATAGGLFLWRAAGATIPIASGSFAGNYPPATGTSRVSADGHHLAFVSSATLADYDNTNQATAKAEPEVYLYSAPVGASPEAIVCASCNPSGESPIGGASLAGASPNGKGVTAPDLYKPRALAADSSRLFFDTTDSLASQDTNKVRDVYEWEAAGVGSCTRPSGCVGLISSGRSETGATFVDASNDTTDAFILTDGSLVAGDPGSVDVYDARIGGGYPPPPSVIPCAGDDCQVLPPEPEDPTPGTLRVAAGNKPVSFPRGCPKGKVRKQGKCVKKKQPRKAKHGSKK